MRLLSLFHVSLIIKHVSIVCSVLVSHLCPTLCDPRDYSLPGSSVHGILQARILDWVAVPFSRGIFPTQGSNLGLLHYRQILYHLSHQGSPLFSTVHYNLRIWGKLTPQPQFPEVPMQYVCSMTARLLAIV